MVRSISTASFLVGILAIATLLRVALLGDKSLSLEEISSIFSTRLDWGSFFKVFAPREVNMTFYYVLLRVWRLAGENEVVIRSLSVAAGVATIPVLYLLGRRLFGPRVGLVAAFLISINSYHIEFSQYARSYSLLAFLATLSSLLFVNCLERPCWGNWLGYLVVGVLGVYSHLFAAFVLLAQWVSLVFLRLRDVPWRGWLISALCMVLLLLPLGIIAMPRTPTWGTWVPVPKFRDIPYVYFVLTGERGGRTGILLVLFYCIACVIALLGARRARAFSGTLRPLWRYGFLLTWLFLPVLAAFAVSQVKSIFFAHYMIICLPPLMLLAAVGLDAMPKRALIGGLVIVTLLSSHQIYKYYVDYNGHEDFRGATRYILSHVRAEDAVVIFAPYIQKSFEYYRERFEGASKLPPFTILSMDTRVLQLWQRLRDAARDEPADPLPSGTEPPSHYHRVWLMLSHDWDREPGVLTVSRSIQASWARKYCSVAEERFTDVRVLLYDTPRSGGCR
ncbi:MAG TPA: glycosyltransferase family 39 protein [bacterium]|nr:glycosyltransferase family 39 protein [bacterium]